jgi:hypothetical protein
MKIKQSSRWRCLPLDTNLVSCVRDDVDLEVPSSASVGVPHPDTLDWVLAQQSRRMDQIRGWERGMHGRCRADNMVREKNPSTDEWTDRKWGGVRV